MTATPPKLAIICVSHAEQGRIGEKRISLQGLIKNHNFVQGIHFYRIVSSVTVTAYTIMEDEVLLNENA